MEMHKSTLDGLFMCKWTLVSLEWTLDVDLKMANKLKKNRIKIPLHILSHWYDVTDINPSNCTHMILNVFTSLLLEFDKLFPIFSHLFEIFHFIFFFSLQDVLEEYAERVKRRGAVVKIDPAYLRWTPFVPPAPTTSS